MTSQHKDWKKVKEQATEEDVLNAPEELDEDNSGGEEDGEVSTLDHPSYELLEQKLTQAEQKAHDSWEKLVRSMAEVDNIRRRAERDIANAHRYALDKFMNTLLPVADSLEHAIAIAERQQDTTMQEGLEMTIKLLLDAFEKAEVKVINPIDTPFDPQFHEAMSMQEKEGVPANTVLMVFQKGYLLNDRVIRPARVVVSK